MYVKKSLVQLELSSLLLKKNGNKQKMQKRQNWKNQNMQQRDFFSLKQQQIIQLYMKLFVDKIIHNLLI